MSEVLSQPIVKTDIAPRVFDLTVRERNWWFLNGQAEALPDFVHFPKVGNGFRLISRIRSGKEPNTALPGVLDVTERIAENWRERISKFIEEPGEWFLAITSLFRSPDFQSDLLWKNLNAVSRYSTHTVGAAVDIDPRGFYVKRKGQFQSVNARLPKYKRKLTEELYMAITRDIGSKRINFVPEVRRYKTKTDYSCFHVCVSPEYKLRNNPS